MMRNHRKCTFQVISEFQNTLETTIKHYRVETFFESTMNIIIILLNLE